MSVELLDDQAHELVAAELVAPAIRFPDGAVVTDPSWRCVADVIGAAHGHVGRTRMPGELVWLTPTPDD